MKNLLILISTILIMVLTPTDYCDGWNEGYKEGWCYQRQNCIAPIVPTCPLAKIGETTYKDGYNRGFTNGKNDRK